jgi:hypothetical protein
MPTRTVPDLSARYLPEWAIYCHSNVGVQRHIYEVTNRKQTNKQNSRLESHHWISAKSYHTVYGLACIFGLTILNYQVSQ